MVFWPMLFAKSGERTVIGATLLRPARMCLWCSAACLGAWLSACRGDSEPGVDRDAAHQGSAGAAGDSAANAAPECYPALGSPVDIDAFDRDEAAFALSDDGFVGMAPVSRGLGYRVAKFSSSGRIQGAAQALWTDTEPGYRPQLAVSGDVLALAELGADEETQESICRLAMVGLGDLAPIRPPTIVGEVSSSAISVLGVDRCVVAAAGQGFVVLWHLWIDEMTGESAIFAQAFDRDGNETGDRITIAEGQAPSQSFAFASDRTRVVVPVEDTPGEASELAFIEDGKLSTQSLATPLALASLTPAHGGFVATTELDMSAAVMLLDRDGGLSRGPVEVAEWARAAALDAGYVVVANEEYLVARTLDADLGAVSEPAGISDDPAARLVELLSPPDGSRVGLIYSEGGNPRFVRLTCSDAPGPAPGPARCPEQDETEPLDDGCADAVCHVLVRLDYMTLGLRGWAVIGGAVDPVDSTGAVAQAAAVFDGRMSGNPTSVRGPEAGLFAALESAGDFGGFALVGQESGLAVAGGGIEWSGVGDYWIPTAWNDPGDLSCGRESVEPTETYLDPNTCASVVSSGTPATASEALDVVLSSNLAAHIASEGPFSAYAFLYTRTVGECRPQNAEYLVVLTRGQ
jgi:hypothetical protein